MRFPTYDFARSPSVRSFGGLWSEVAGSSQPPVWSWPRKKILLTLALNCISTLSYRFRLKWATTKNTGRVFCCGYIFESRGWFKQYRHVCIWLDAGKLWKKNVQKTSSFYSFVVAWAYCNAILQEVPSAERYFFIAFRNFIKIDYEKHLFY